MHPSSRRTLVTVDGDVLRSRAALRRSAPSNGNIALRSTTRLRIASRTGLVTHLGLLDTDRMASLMPRPAPFRARCAEYMPDHFPMKPSDTPYVSRTSTR